MGSIVKRKFLSKDRVLILFIISRAAVLAVSFYAKSRYTLETIADLILPAGFDQALETLEALPGKGNGQGGRYGR